MDYNVRSHELGNLPRSYYYIKQVLQFVRLVINIKERVYSILKKKGAHHTLAMRCMVYA
jgi:hypothetical protein